MSESYVDPGSIPAYGTHSDWHDGQQVVEDGQTYTAHTIPCTDDGPDWELTPSIPLTADGTQQPAPSAPTPPADDGNLHTPDIDLPGGLKGNLWWNGGTDPHGTVYPDGTIDGGIAGGGTIHVDF